MVILSCYWIVAVTGAYATLPAVVLGNWIKVAANCCGIFTTPVPQKLVAWR